MIHILKIIIDKEIVILEEWRFLRKRNSEHRRYTNNNNFGIIGIKLKTEFGIIILVGVYSQEETMK